MSQFKLRKAKREHSCWDCRIVISKREQYYANGKGCTICSNCYAKRKTPY